jgi:hypothetical protein
MSDTTTPNYGFDLPTVGASQDTWGGKLNANWVAADSVIHGLASGYLTLGGGSLGGSISINPPASYAQLVLNKPAGTFADQVVAERASTLRWILDLADATAEGGSNAGSNCTLSRYDDGGNFLGTPLAINRATGNVTIAQALNVGGAVSAPSAAFSGQVGGASFNSASGFFYVGNTSNYYLGRGSDADWRFVENGTTNFTVLGNGDCSVRGVLFAGTTVQAAGNVLARNGLTYMGNGGSGVAFQFSTSWYLDWSSANGTLQYVTTAGNFIVARTSDLLFFNNLGQIGGHGPYADISDARSKSSIEDSALGLDAVLRLRPVSFQRIRRDADPRPPKSEIGFVAQEVAEVIPEAVQAIGMELHDGSGGENSAEPSLALTTTAIIAALVNAVKELTERVASLELQGA